MIPLSFDWGIFFVYIFFMCNDPLFRLRQNEDFVNEMLNRPITSYSEYKQREEDTKVLFLIKDHIKVNLTPIINKNGRK